jgi:hypothetical protein
MRNIVTTECDDTTLLEDTLLLYFDFQDEITDELDSDFAIDEDAESDSDSAWFDQLPNDDVFVSEADYPIMFLSPKERRVYQQNILAAETEEEKEGDIKLIF